MTEAPLDKPQSKFEEEGREGDRRAISAPSCPPSPPLAGYTISIRTPRGRILVAIEAEALQKLRDDENARLLSVLAKHVERFRAVALQQAARADTSSVVIRAEDVWWPAERLN
ncbi:MAG: hypothetical protein JWQ73_1129 [Variovorax sp.]|jgi:hypothetical protein|nr:hypothetical protein [Variovorax sp.]